MVASRSALRRANMLSSSCLRSRHFPSVATLGIGAGIRSSAALVPPSPRFFGVFGWAGTPSLNLHSTTRTLPKHPLQSKQTPQISTIWNGLMGYIAGLGISIAAIFGAQSQVLCESVPETEPHLGASPPKPNEGDGSLPDPSGPLPANSIVDAKQLGFGTIAGICTGIFVKKGLKLIAFALGGVYILLQYMSSQKWITINWSALASRYDKWVDVAADVPEDPASPSSSRAWRIWQRFAHFLTHNFQERATFLAGFVLGVRLG